MHVGHYEKPRVAVITCRLLYYICICIDEVEHEITNIYTRFNVTRVYCYYSRYASFIDYDNPQRKWDICITFNAGV